VKTLLSNIKILFSILLLFMSMLTFAAPHGADSTLTPDQFFGKWYRAVGSIIRSDGSVKMLNSDKGNEYYIFRDKGIGILLTGKQETSFSWNVIDGGITLKYKDGYKEVYSTAVFFDSLSLSISGRFDYYQNGQECGVILALYKQGSMFYQ
jgi:hypothetical protein